MTCPHCLIAFHEAYSTHELGRDSEFGWAVVWTQCPSCKKFTILLDYEDFLGNHRAKWAYPKGMGRAPIPPEVPKEFSGDYKEACSVLGESEKASAALSRRCLQNLLREMAGVKKSDLDREIQQVLDSKQLPSHLADQIDAIRATGNFAAHPMKSTNTGEIIEIEPGEAIWQLDTLEGLFDFYFVQPAKAQQRRDALNMKLEKAGKPPLKKGQK